MYNVLLPLAIVLFASIGCGYFMLLPIRRGLGAGTRLTLSFVLGQGTLATLLMFIAITKLFTLAWLYVLLLPFALYGVYVFYRTSPFVFRKIQRSKRLWKKLPFCWKLVSGAVIFVVMLGSATFAVTLRGDAVAYYLVLPKLISYTGQMTLVPGYETFSFVGMLGECIFAALMTLGMPGSTCRIWSWLDTLFMLPLLCVLAKELGIMLRGRIIVLAILLSSTALLFLWGTGKVDLFAVAPIFAGCLCAVYSFKQTKQNKWLFYCGAFVGLGVVYKLSYLACALPMFAVFLAWDSIIICTQAIFQKRWNILGAEFKSQLCLGLFFILGFACFFLPLIIKNLFLFNTVMGNAQVTTFSGWFSPITTVRIILSYPFALTFGKYWAQFGCLSVLILAGLPLYFVYVLYQGHQRLFQLTCAVCISMLCYIIAFPTVFIPRYFLAVLLLLSFPVALTFDRLSKKSLFQFVIPFFILFSLYMGQYGLLKNLQSNFFYMYGKSIEYLLHPEQENISANGSVYFTAHNIINDLAKQDERVLMLSYYTFWFKPKLIFTSREKDVKNLYGKSLLITEWKKLREFGFKYIFYARTHEKSWNNLLKNIPADVGLKEHLYLGNETIKVYEIVWNKNKEEKQFTSTFSGKYTHTPLELNKPVPIIEVTALEGFRKGSSGGFIKGSSKVGAWIHDDKGVLALDLSVGDINRDMTLSLSLMSLVNEKHPVQRIEVDVSGIELPMLSLTTADEQKVDILIPKTALQKNKGKIILTLTALDAVIPKSIGASGYDATKLSILVRELILKQE